MLASADPDEVDYRIRHWRRYTAPAGTVHCCSLAFEAFIHFNPPV
jgi:hypothetical protein